ncbi:MAG: SPOR domain-containing protein [Prevotella sp.]|uniref:SPOR domain-containing protein n=1 Tax=Prevotella heparinolytica TaxID=28113 RepID=UPI002A9532AD|nr:SPOR domain-containing protein [Prevotella sp.]
MKKTMFLCAGLCLALTLTSCKPKESAYKKAYEKAKNQETTQGDDSSWDTPTVTPIVTAPVTDNRVVDNLDNVSVRQEKVTIVNGAGLQDFSVVVGSFSLKANAEGLQSKLKSEGYDAQIAYNADRNMYRVIASTFADKSQAVQSREKFRMTYPDAWLLYNVR